MSFHQIVPREPLLCSVCQRSMRDVESNSSVVGLHISVQDTSDESAYQEASHKFSEAFHRIYPELALPLNIVVCYVCWLKSLGVELR